MFFRGKSPERGEKRVLLLEVMELRGAHLPDTLSPQASAALEEAKRRCLSCSVTELCREALAARNARAFSLFCANNAYIQHVRGSSLSFG